MRIFPRESGKRDSAGRMAFPIGKKDGRGFSAVGVPTWQHSQRPKKGHVVYARSVPTVTGDLF